MCASHVTSIKSHTCLTLSDTTLALARVFITSLYNRLRRTRVRWVQIEGRTVGSLDTNTT